MIRRPLLPSHTIRRLEGTLFIAPWIIGFFAFVAFPLAFSLYMSFHRVKVTVGGIETIPNGWGYYREILFADGGLLYDSLIPFLREAALMIPIILVFSLLVAILLNQNFRGRTFFRVVFFLPVIFSSGQIILEFIKQGEGTLAFVESLRIDAYLMSYVPASWAQPIHNVLNSFVLVLWYSGVQILIFLAGRQTISSSVYEAARIDGADPWNTFWKITLPGLVPFVFLNLMFTVVDLFTFPGNPIISQVTTANYGLSSALAWIYFMIILVFVGLVLGLYGKVDRAFAGKR
ncbi:carbohydrate ABC transporter permease [Paenibacillus mucilaginosus]|uniref:Binding-protein-dependent transport systems inner membrane component n=3 Tax=Paenibacillus mucilaginosus TaxID=61624 RepID=H6NFU9_9BACL|nr:sugar ABC transporter permease [Paenibacillus mucilaginosus]AEI43054.1 binding-protein-dependent transport systems inner membrane component [Paenibacillus mucilaginosus KNP414]AFC30739.1 binding-protein-dependent transport systems inner membrane component [Paenibacillus mucilaginosus 3016]AFH63059.1 ABC transporter permease [Paenibacillus mucilaginosus K02]MCG7215993.1 sugar ABC transporter permease [Paenibacillus mucilaginosus]WDM24676.1 sugar ABC transporter permease [Paenibacillus mucila